MPRLKLPKAYLRLDPNIDETHPEWQWLVLLLLKANRQPVRGRFKDQVVLERALEGPERFARFAARQDILEAEDGSWYVAGWDDWQEGDLEVGERMARLRAKREAAVVAPVGRNGTVTSDGKPSRPSEALGRKGVETDSPPVPPAAAGGASHGRGAGGAGLAERVDLLAAKARRMGVPAARRTLRDWRQRLRQGVADAEIAAEIERDAAAQAEALRRRDEEQARELIALGLADGEQHADPQEASRRAAAAAWIQGRAGPAAVARGVAEWIVREQRQGERLESACARWAEGDAVRLVVLSLVRAQLKAALLGLRPESPWEARAPGPRRAAG